MKSGRIVERRDQVLIGFLSREAAAASTFFSKWASQNGPFLTERAIADSLALVTALNDHRRRALVAAGAITLGRGSPRADRIATCCRLTFTTTVRAINRVDCNATHRRVDTAPAVSTGLTDLTEAMLFVANFTNRRAALDVHTANLTRTQANLSVRAFTSQQHGGRTSRTRHLRALARQHLDAVNRRADRNVADRQGVTRADRRFRTRHQRLTHRRALRSDDVLALAVCVQNQRDVRATVRIVLKTFDLCRNPVLVATEIDQTVVLLVTATFVTRRDATGVVPAGGHGLCVEQRCVRLALMQILVDHLDHRTATRRSRFNFYDCHDYLASASKLISWPGLRQTYAFFTFLRLPMKRPKRLALPFVTSTLTELTSTLNSSSTAAFTSCFVASGATSNTTCSFLSATSVAFSEITGASRTCIKR